MADEIQITSHCLLRLTTALMLEAHGIDHGCPSATAELNQMASRSLSPREWLAVLEPHYCAQFCPEADSAHA